MLATVKMSSKGQIVIPKNIREKYGLEDRTTEFVISENEDGTLNLRKIPNRFDWEKALSNIPVEDAVFNEDGTIDRSSSPNFYDWMVNG